MASYKTHPGGVFFNTNIMVKPITYLKEVRNEMKHVSWPTRKQALVFTVITIVIALLTAVYLGALDFIFTEIVGGVL